VTSQETCWEPGSSQASHLTAAWGPGWLFTTAGEQWARTLPGWASGSTGPHGRARSGNWSNRGVSIRPEQGLSRAGVTAGQGSGLVSAACQALTARVVISGGEQVSKGTGFRLRSGWEGLMESLEPHHLERVFSQYRSIYSLEIKDLRSTGHFVLPRGVGAGRGGVGLALPFFPCPGPSDDWSDSRLPASLVLLLEPQCPLSGPQHTYRQEKIGAEHYSGAVGAFTAWI